MTREEDNKEKDHSQTTPSPLPIFKTPVKLPDGPLFTCPTCGFRKLTAKVCRMNKYGVCVANK